MTQTISFNFNKTLIISVLLHAGFVVAAMVFSTSSIKPLPLGVELAYESIPATSAVTPQNLANNKIRPQVVEKEDVLVPAKDVLPSASATPVPPVNESARPAVFSGREGVADGAEVSSEERYLYELKKLLERRKNYPMMARKMGHSGTVTMRFTLKADGTLMETEVVGKAPYETLNQAALTLVQSINGMKPFPQDIQRDSWSITVPIEYKLN